MLIPDIILFMSVSSGHYRKPKRKVCVSRCLQYQCLIPQPISSKQPLLARAISIYYTTKIAGWRRMETFCKQSWKLETCRRAKVLALCRQEFANALASSKSIHAKSLCGLAAYGKRREKTKEWPHRSAVAWESEVPVSLASCSLLATFLSPCWCT